MTNNKVCLQKRGDGAADKLRAQGMLHVGRIELPNNDTFSAVIELAEAADWEKATYGFAIGDKIQRIGSSKGKFGGRSKECTRDVTLSRHDKHKHTPKLAAEGWRKCLRQIGPGEDDACIGYRVTTPVGTFPAYKHEEAVLIAP